MVTTLLTSVTGFFFPFHRILRSHILGVLSVIALVIAVYARYPVAWTAPGGRLM